MQNSYIVYFGSLLQNCNLIWLGFGYVHGYFFMTFYLHDVAQYRFIGECDLQIMQTE